MTSPLPSLRRWLGLSLFLLVAACASAAPAPDSPEPPPAQPAPEAEPVPETEPSPEVAVPRRAPSLWHMLDPDTDEVEGASIARAHAALLDGREPSRTIVVAVIDSGIDTAHVALNPQLWMNEGERAGTGEDDDGNGYPDDVRGWNFLGGPDGRSVEKDTWEVARLHALCTDPESAPPAPPPLPDQDKCERVEADFNEQVAEAEEILANVRNISNVLEIILPMLGAEVGDSLTVENVAALQSSDPRLQEARAIYLELAELTITPADVEEALEEFETQLAYKLNPSFDPRHKVGDDYTDPTERYYGNPDVAGEFNSHGTHVAGIIAGVRDDGSNLESAAAAIRIMPVRAVPNGDERDKDVANAIRYAVDNGAHIINMSFGKGYSPQKAVVDEAVRYADERGVLMVHAAGNSGKDLAIEPSFPNRTYLDGGEAANWIEVGASSWRGADTLVAPFSNYGQEQVDLFAPGVDIMSAAPGGAFDSNSGTSMAAPVVAGIAALVMAYYPELTATEVRTILLESATRYPDRTVLRPGGEEESVPFGTLSVTGGVVNAYEALRVAAQMSGHDP